MLWYVKDGGRRRVMHAKQPGWGSHPFLSFQGHHIRQQRIAAPEPNPIVLSPTRQHVQADALDAVLDGALHQQQQLVVPAAVQGSGTAAQGCRQVTRGHERRMQLWRMQL